MVPRKVNSFLGDESCSQFTLRSFQWLPLLAGARNWTPANTSPRLRIRFQETCYHFWDDDLSVPAGGSIPAGNTAAQGEDCELFSVQTLEELLPSLDRFVEGSDAISPPEKFRSWTQLVADMQNAEGYLGRLPHIVPGGRRAGVFFVEQ